MLRTRIPQNYWYRAITRYVLLLLMAVMGLSLTVPRSVTASAEPASSTTDPTDIVFSLQLTTNDIVYNPRDGLIYAAIPSVVGEMGNSITRIDPLNGAIVGSVYVGSEPSKLALSQDGQTLYVTLRGAYAIRTYNTVTQTAGLQFPIGTDGAPAAAPLSATDIAVSPSNSALLAVAREYPGLSNPAAGVAMFNNGVRLPNVGSGPDSAITLAFSDSASTLYGGSLSGLRSMTVDENGVTDVTGDPTPFQVFYLKFQNQTIFTWKGQIIDPVNRTLLRTCNGIETPAFVPDAATGRVFYATRVGSSVVVHAYDINNCSLIGSIPVPTGPGIDASTLIRYGTNGLALRASNDRIYFIQTLLIPTTDPLPTPSSIPTETPTPTPTPYVSFIRTVPLPNNDLIYSGTEQKFYVGVRNVVGDPLANSITRVDPVTGTIGNSVPLGGEPTRLALSDNGQVLYAGMDTLHAIRKFDVPSQTPGLQFELGVGVNGQKYPYDIDVMPGNENTIAVSYGPESYNYDGADIYDDGVKRQISANTSGAITFGSANTLYVGENGLNKYAVIPTGLTPQGFIATSSSGEGEIKDGYYVGTNGFVVELLTGTFKGRFSFGTNSTVATDVQNNRAYFLLQQGNNWVIRTFALDTFLPMGTIELPGASIFPGTRRLIRWGDNGLAVRGSDDLYFIQSDLISPIGAVPSAVQLSSQTFSGEEDGGSLAVTVTRTGGSNSILMVDYTTMNGTALAGSDYVAVAGTVTFAPGETVRTINIPLINNNVFELDETFNITLSNARGDGILELQDPRMATLTITDLGDRPALTSPDISFSEPSSGTNYMLLTVQLSAPISQTATVQYSTSNDTAFAGSDYIATGGTLTFAPFETTKLIGVQIRADLNYFEPDEYFFINFTDGVNLSTPGPTRVTIINFRPYKITFDYDGDRRSDISVFRPSTGDWYLQRSTAGFWGQNFGSAEDRIAPADYDGDGKTDIAVFRPSTGTWYVSNSSNGTFSYYGFGISEDLPTPADYDGDGKADISVFRPSTGTWYRINSVNGSFSSVQFGANGDKPSIGDFDGDGRTDIAIYRPSTGTWYIASSLSGTIFGEQFGVSTDKITPADYDGDGRTDIAIYRPSEGLWYVRQSATTTYVPYVFGLGADIPTPGDFDGDGKADIGVFRPSDGTWYIVNSSNGSYTIQQFGQNGDQPTQSGFRN